jgi:hypothetical protein
MPRGSAAQPLYSRCDPREMQDFACQAGGFAAPGLTRKYKNIGG